MAFFRHGVYLGHAGHSHSCRTGLAGRVASGAACCSGIFSRSADQAGPFPAHRSSRTDILSSGSLYFRAALYPTAVCCPRPHAADLQRLHFTGRNHSAPGGSGAGDGGVLLGRTGRSLYRSLSAAPSCGSRRRIYLPARSAPSPARQTGLAGSASYCRTVRCRSG